MTVVSLDYFYCVWQVTTALSDYQQIAAKTRSHEHDLAVYLGVRLTADLRWNVRVTLLCSKASNMLSFLHHNFRKVSPILKETLYLHPADFKLHLYCMGPAHAELYKLNRKNPKASCGMCI